MGGIEMFRSEEMQLMQLLIPAEAAHATVAALGRLGTVQFKDLNADRPAFQRTFASHVKRCDEMARRLRVFEAAAVKAGALPASGVPSIPSTVGTPAAAGDTPLDALEARLADLEAQLVDAAGAAERVDRARAELGELSLVLETASRFFDDAHRRAVAGAASGGGGVGDEWGQASSSSLLDPAGPDAPLLGGGGGLGGGDGASATSAAARLTCVAGTVPASRAAAFERLLFRATRGNCVYRDVAVGRVLDPGTCALEEKHVFVVFVAGDRAKAKVTKAADAHGARRYPYPDSPARAAALASEVGGRLRDLDAAASAGDAQRRALVSTLASGLPAWAARVRAEAAVYATLNRFSVDVTRQVLVGEAWVPVRARAAAAAAARAAAAGAAAGATPVLQPLLTYESPPTHFAPTKILAPFQSIVDAYATASYREVNPAVLTVITFPFLFAVMFGDVGHAALMLLAAGAMIAGEAAVARSPGGQPPGGDMGAMAFGGRYCILLMAVFSLFTGLIYNEAFSIPMSLFGGGRWACPGNPGLTSPARIRADPASCPAAFAAGLAPTHGGRPYPFGVDPAWHGSRTELSFLNSVKMKMSILLGVTQMNAGIGLSLLNQRARRDRLSTLTEFWPQLIFLNALFGYLCLLIVVKWASGSTADLYHTLIYMFLAPGDGGLTCGGRCEENRMFRGQGGLQALLVLAAFVAVPWMLVPKPLILKRRAEAAAGAAALAPYGALTPPGSDCEDDDEAGGGGGRGRGGERRRLVGGGGAPASSSHPPPPAGGHDDGHGHGGEFDFSEVVVHQAIHTIEFVLGAVSNTASYLRLWALSLAHSQLSAVFYDRVLLAGIRSGSPAALFVAFWVFACATLGVLMVMETLSAFLHALRLHWVEFNSKFFAGGGHAFVPFVVE